MAGTTAAAVATAEEEGAMEGEVAEAAAEERTSLCVKK
jgi:hypothetical protein